MGNDAGAKSIQAKKKDRKKLMKLRSSKKVCFV